MLIIMMKQKKSSVLTDTDSDPSNYTSNIIEKIIRSKGAKEILYLDISNCYISIYTHYLASIKICLDKAKKLYILQKQNKKLVYIDYLKYVELDNIIRRLNSNESNGILTGPHVSNYIVEAYLSRIDIDIESELSMNVEYNFKDFVRYVDDYEFFIYDDKDIEKMINTVEKVFNKYKLILNNLKTKYITFPYYAVKNLNKLYEKHEKAISSSSDNIIEMFNNFFILEKDGTKGAIHYLIKLIGKDIKIYDNNLYNAYLLNVLINDSRSFVKVCKLINVY